MFGMSRMRGGRGGRGRVGARGAKAQANASRKAGLLGGLSSLRGRRASSKAKLFDPRTARPARGSTMGRGMLSTARAVRGGPVKAGRPRVTRYKRR